VDLDPIALYHRIHGLSAPARERANEALDLALERFLDFASIAGVPLTLFVVGRELERPAFARRLERAVAAGHELGNHTLDHPYNLVRLSRQQQREQIEAPLELCQRLLGVRPRGFRAPGYVVTDDLLELVRASGHLYDSSVFPSPAYYAAKSAARAALTLAGRRSETIIDRLDVLRAPTRPYRLGRPYHVPGDGLPELPIQVTRGLRLPFIGTGLILAGTLGARALTELVIGEPFINLELHAIDLLDPRDGLEALRGFQPDLRSTTETKLRIFNGVVNRLKRARYEFVRLDRAAKLVG
jgi:peptidoglycan/xylan/chitin deacetylase (PgdA/CDA1 family)